MLKTCPIPWRPPHQLSHDLHAQRDAHGHANAPSNGSEPSPERRRCGKSGSGRRRAWRRSGVDRVDICRGVERGDDQHDKGVEPDHHQLPERSGPNPDQEERDRRQGRDRAQHLDGHLGQGAETSPSGHGQPRRDPRRDPDRAAGQREQDCVAEVRPKPPPCPHPGTQAACSRSEQDDLGEDHLQGGNR